MTTIAALRRTSTAMVLFLGLAGRPAAAQQQDQLTGDALLQAKCTPCHSGHRIYRLTPDQIRPVVERMRKMNPDWITAIDNDHIVEVITRILDDPSAQATREAWREAVDRGEALYKDAGLGTTGKSCSSCHTKQSLKNVADAYPKFDLARKRFVDINEKVNLMIKENMKGAPLAPTDERFLDLLLFIKSIK